MKKIFFLFLVVFVIGIIPDLVFAYSVPENDSKVKYFYVFGPNGNPNDGADITSPEQAIFFDVPQAETAEITIDVFDPDTGGRVDQRPSSETPADTLKLDNPWETIVKFAVYGKDDALLEAKSFNESTEYDMKYYRFGPYTKEMGQKVGEFYRFKLVASPVVTYVLDGNDLNLFNVRVSPEDVETFSHKISFRMLPKEGDVMYFYPEIPAGVSEIITENYDIDPEGGSAVLYDPLNRKSYKIKDSGSGAWVETKVEIGVSNTPRRLVYMITKKTQQFGNAAVRVKDDKGNLLPIYFSEEVRKIIDSNMPSAAIRYVKAKKEEMKPEKLKAKPVPVKKEVQKTMSKVAAPVIKTAPQPKITGVQCNKFIFDGTRSYDPNKEKLTYLWDFGDGTTSTEPVVTHVFDKAGQYKVTLTVKDTSGLECDTASTTQVVNVNMPPVPSFTAPETVCVGQDVGFDASATIDDAPQNLTYFWDFGDATTTEGKQVTKKFEKRGVHTVKLTVNDNAGTACSTASVEKKISVNTPPVARTEGNITMCIAAEKDYAVVFNASKSNDADGDSLSYSWDFGDGENGEGRTVNHVYKKGGIYTAKLTVNDGRSLPCSTAEERFSVTLNKPPVAKAGPNFVCCINTESTFSASSSSDADGDALSYWWGFGDGTTAQGEKVTHVYTKGGKYLIKLKVDDNSGTACSSSETSFDVQVNDQPVPVIKIR